MHPDQPHSDDSSVPDPIEPLSSESAGEAVDGRPNRAARRGKHTGAAPGAAPAHGPASHARGAQGRRINPVRRSG